MTPVIQFDHVSKKFRLHRHRPRSLQEVFLNIFRRQRPKTEKLWSLRDVSFDVQRGEMVGLIGANGAGKSTALKLVSRIIEPTKGRVTVKGKVTGLLELGAGFHPDLTGRENVFLNGAIMGMHRQQVKQRLEDIVTFAELEEFIDVPVKHYSSGMFMRLGFATAVHSDIDILLVDEVLAVGDQAFQTKCYQKITELRREGTTILFVSHNAATVRRMCDTAIWLDKGKMKSIGAADDVIADYMQAIWQERNAWRPQASKPSEQRWGSGEAIIEDVVFLGRDGKERHAFCTGEPFIARIYYQARTPVKRPTFGIAIYRDDNAHINGPNSAADGYEIPMIEGSGQMDYIVEELPLLPGHYQLTAAIYDHSSTHPYDHRHRAFSFEVQSGPVGLREGIVHIPNTWRHRP